MKRDFGSQLALYPMPTVIVGTMIQGRPNFLTVTHVGIMGMDHISLSMARIHYSNQGILANKTFSVNIPGESLAEKTDYIGTVSGKKKDKSKIFDIFYGELPSAPMITDCPVNMECRLVRTLDFMHHDIFIGEVVKTWCDEEAISKGKIDLAKVKPLLFDMNQKLYWRIGPAIGHCWYIGKKEQD